MDPRSRASPHTGNPSNLRGSTIALTLRLRPLCPTPLIHAPGCIQRTPTRKRKVYGFYRGNSRTILAFFPNPAQVGAYKGGERHRAPPAAYIRLRLRLVLGALFAYGLLLVLGALSPSPTIAPRRSWVPRYWHARRDISQLCSAPRTRAGQTHARRPPCFGEPHRGFAGSWKGTPHRYPHR